MYNYMAREPESATRTPKTTTLRMCCLGHCMHCPRGEDLSETVNA